MTAARDALRHSSGGDHAGLLLNRYLQEAVYRGENRTRKDAFTDSKRKIIDRALQATRADVYSVAFERWKETLPEDAIRLRAKCLNRVLIGFGGENVTETGLTLHHTYGIPYLPGTSLKGLAAHYAHSVWGEVDDAWKIDGENHRVIFGNQNEGGLIVFHDGWLTANAGRPLTPLRKDVLTAHHVDYYMNDGEATDFDDPNPVQFLSVSGAFEIALSKRDPRLHKGWLDAAQKLVTDSALQWGLGAKTQSGYGRFEITESRAVTTELKTAKPSPTFKNGDTVEIEIREKSRSGNWRACIVGHPTCQGTVKGKLKKPKAGVKLEAKILNSKPVGNMQFEAK